MKKTLKENMRDALRAQREWVAERGGDLGGYLAFYKTRPYANVVAIYEADMAELRALEERWGDKR